MAKFRIAIKLFPGWQKIPFPALLQALADANQFVKSLSADMGISSKPDDWVTSDFEGGSLELIDTCEREAPPETVKEATRAVRTFVDPNFRDPRIRKKIKRSTDKKYKKLIDSIPQGKTISLGVFENGSARPDAYYPVLSKREQKPLAPSEKTQYYGEIQGVVKVFVKEAKRPKIEVRDLSSGMDIDCFFSNEKYEEAVSTLSDRDAIIFVEGMVTEDLTTGRILSIDAEHFFLAPKFDAKFYSDFLGSHPNLTGKLSSDEYLKQYRANA